MTPTEADNTQVQVSLTEWLQILRMVEEIESPTTFYDPDPLRMANAVIAAQQLKARAIRMTIPDAVKEYQKK